MKDMFQLQKVLLVLVICLSLHSKFGNTQCLSERDDHPILFYPAPPVMDLSCIQNFSIGLFKEVVPKDPTTNFVFSPYSVWNALVLAYLGSAGETENQLMEVLRVPDKITTLNQWKRLRYMCRKRTEDNPDTQFLTGSRAYFDNDVEIRECMLDILKDDIKQLDFMNDTIGSAEMINDFISETTRKHIKEIVTPADLQGANFTIVNAAFFKGKWEIPFLPELTELKPFKTFDSQEIYVPMMNQRDIYKYAVDEDGQFDVLELPYVGNYSSMYIFRPREINMSVFDSMIDNLTEAKINSLLSSLTDTDVEICLPKFSTESVICHDLIAALQEMGLTDPFSQTDANFTGFTSDADIFINHGVHKAFIEADEEGTTTATSTGWIQPTSLPERFFCDRPFVYIIRDNEAKNILFMGTYKKPVLENLWAYIDI